MGNQLCSRATKVSELFVAERSIAIGGNDTAVCLNAEFELNLWKRDVVEERA
jgi:hypothetical protein